jgi:isopenicillin N synthase-like dioxygenase
LTRCFPSYVLFIPSLLAQLTIGEVQNQRFFDLPLEKKEELAYTSSKANRGYLACVSFLFSRLS